MINPIKFCLLITILILVFSSCKKENTEANPLTTGAEYFSSVVGMTRIYQIDSIYWDDFTHAHDTISYQVKEVIPSTYYDNQNRETQKIERFLRNPVSGEWVIWKVWHANITNVTAEMVEDNIRFLKFTLSPKLNATWNGNTYNSLDAQYYKITAINVDDTLGNNIFTSTLKIIQYDDNNENKLQRKFSEERYAKGAGLYYRVNEDVQKDLNTGTIVSGYIYTEKLLSYSITP